MLPPREGKGHSIDSTHSIHSGAPPPLASSEYGRLSTHWHGLGWQRTGEDGRLPRTCPGTHSLHSAPLYSTRLHPRGEKHRRAARERRNTVPSQHHSIHHTKMRQTDN